MRRQDLGRLGACGLLFLACLSGSAHAATIRVTTTGDLLADDGLCSLREAVLSANQDVSFGGCSAGNGADTIVLRGETYSLAIPGGDEDLGYTGDLDVTGPLKIVSRVGDTVIDADGIDRVLDVHPVAVVTVEHLALVHGDAPGSIVSFERGGGGGVFNEVASRSTVSSSPRARAPLTGVAGSSTREPSPSRTARSPTTACRTSSRTPVGPVAAS
jgi:CSLREA domain-containing protein